MATLQKFKLLLATQCAIAGSPTRSPTPNSTRSPIIYLRRRKSLRMLLSRSGGGGGGRRLRREEDSPDQQGIVTRSHPPSEKEKRKDLLSRTLKDLFISSPPPPLQADKVTKAVVKSLFPSSIIDRQNENENENDADRRLTVVGSPRPPLSLVFRYRLLLRRAWRPVLVAIPESNETI